MEEPIDDFESFLTLKYRYVASFDEPTIDTWFGYVIAGTLVILAVVLAIGLSYVVVQMLMLILLWVSADLLSQTAYYVISI